jgi:xylose isomerase
MRTSPSKTDPIQSTGHVLVEMDRPWSRARLDHTKLKTDGVLEFFTFLGVSFFSFDESISITAAQVN